MTTASIPPEKMLMYGALAIAGYWFVSRKANASGTTQSRYSLPSNRAAMVPQNTRQARPAYASTDAALFSAAGGILSKLLDRTQTTVNNADGTYSQGGYEGNAPNVYGREELRNFEKGDGYYGGQDGDTYGVNRAYSGPVGSRMGGYGDYSASNDGTAINPAPQFGSVWDAAAFDSQQ